MSHKKERKTYNSEETQTAMDNLNTQGRKGMKAMRINMAFTPELHDYIKVMSKVRGQTLTEFVNDIVGQSLERNKDVYNRARDLLFDICVLGKF